MLDKINDLLKGYFIHDCCILSDNYIFLIAEEHLTQEQYNDGLLGEIKCVNYILSDPQREWGCRYWMGKNAFNRPKLVNTKYNEAMIVCESDMVFYYGTGKNKQYEERLTKDIVHGFESIKRINDDVYICGLRRSVAVRTGVSQWQSLTNGALWSDDLDNVGFYDIDGFAHDDLYAVGGNNDVWRFDGNDWIPLDVTENFRPKVVLCCAEDGYVYIAGSWGMVVRGREDRWETVTAPNLKSSLIFSSIASYQGKVFIGSERTTYVIDHNAKDFTPRLYDFDGQLPRIAARYMSVGHGMLLIANGYRAALHDGEKWVGLYNCS